MLVVVRSIFSL